MKRNPLKLTLHQPETYQIKVPGALNTLWVEGFTSLRVSFEENAAGEPITTLTGLLDQAALLGLLRRLYGLGLPLISVAWVEFGKMNNEDC